jgi:hypothetical protein
MADRTGGRQQAISDRAHAAGDDFAREVGWTITRSTGRLGFGSRTYRDPRFADTAPCAPGGPSRTFRELAQGWEAAP